VFYLKDKYKLIDGGTFWISETPETPSLGWDAGCMRICSWAALESRESGKTYVHFNTHLDRGGELSRQEGTRLLREKLAGCAYPFVMTGDFNFDENSGCYKAMAAGNIADAKFLAPDTVSEITFHHYGRTEYGEEAPVMQVRDFIFVDKRSVRPLTYRVFNEKIDGAYPSDHFPIYSDLELV